MFKKLPWGNCLEVQWLRLHFSVQGPRVSSLVGELRSHILHGTTKKKERKKSYYFETKFLFSDLDSGSESSLCSRIGWSLVLVRFPQFSSLYNTLPFSFWHDWIYLCIFIYLVVLGVLAAALGVRSAMFPLSCPQVCEIFVPQPGMEPETPAWQGVFLNTGLPGMSPLNLIFTLENIH